MNWQRAWRGGSSCAGILGHLAVPFRWPAIASLDIEERRAQGCTFVLPGVEGRSPLNRSLAKGLADGGLAGAIRIFDWTTGAAPLFPIHLRSRVWQARRAKRLAGQIVDYNRDHPTCPVHLVAHSGGAEIALQAVECLPRAIDVQTILFLAAAVSPTRDLTAALSHCKTGLWNFYSPWDWFFLALGTWVAGTSDGCHARAAGNRGFSVPPNAAAETPALYASKLHQVRYRGDMARSWHSGGHISWTNRVFAAEWLAPILLSRCEHSTISTQPAG